MEEEDAADIPTQIQDEPPPTETEAIDCLPSVLPAYTEAITEERITHHPLSRYQSESLEHILSYDRDVEQTGKVCCTSWGCNVCLASCLSFRRLLLVLTIAGVFSIATGVVLGAVRRPEFGFISLSVMFAVLGTLLITVAVLGWRCTPPDNEPCHLLFGLGSYSMVQHRRFLRGQQRHRSRFYSIGGRFFPEFRFRRPPPTYTASMQEHQQYLRARGLIPQTPPPNYKLYSSQRTRSRTRGGVRNCPPPPSYDDEHRDQCQVTDMSVVDQRSLQQTHETVNNSTVTVIHSEVYGQSTNDIQTVTPASDNSLHHTPNRPTNISKADDLVEEDKSDNNSIPVSSTFNSIQFYDMLGEVTHL